MPKMPAPPTTPVYWQLARIDQESDVSPRGGYAVDYEVFGLSLDLADGLLTESLLLSSESYDPEIQLTVSKNGESSLHGYTWNALPVYLEPGVSYPIEVSGISSGALSHSLLGVYAQGEQVARMSADGYNGYTDASSFVISTEKDLYKDGSLVISLVLRDTDDMFRLRIVYNYVMVDGTKPVPTPVPGFVAVDVPDGVVPSYYDAVESMDGLWTVTTAPGQFRAYGSMSGSEPAFFPADENGYVVMNERPVLPAADFDAYVRGFVPTEPSEVPALYSDVAPGVYALTTRDGETLTRAYGRMDGTPGAFYPSDAEGIVQAGEQAVTPESDYSLYVEGFGAAALAEIPAIYSAASEGVYAFTGRDGETRYRVYGRLNGAEPAFYPAAADGQIAPDAKALTPQEDFDAYIKGFDSAKPDALPSYYQVLEGGLYAVEDREGNPVYRVYGVLDGKAPTFYPADAEGKLLEGQGAVDPQSDYEAYVKGFVPADMPDAPTFYEETAVPGVWTFTDTDGKAHYRVYGELNRGEAAFYPADSQGNVSESALPVLPASDLAIIPPPPFVPAVPQAVPSYYNTVEGQDGVYTFDGRDGEPLYRAYGAYGKAEPGFYPADAAGNPLENSEPADPEKDFADFIEGFVQKTPDSPPAHYTVVSDNLYSMPSRENEILYRVYGSKDQGAPAFYPADSEGRLLSDEPVLPGDDVALLPTPFSGSVVTPQPADAGATPLVRLNTGVSVDSSPAPLTFTLVPVAATDNTLPPVGRFVPGADATATPMETTSVSAIAKQTPSVTGSPVNRSVPGADTTATPLETTSVSAITSEMPSTTGSPVNRSVPGADTTATPLETTSVSAIASQTPSTTDSQAVISYASAVPVDVTTGETATPSPEKTAQAAQTTPGATQQTPETSPSAPTKTATVTDAPATAEPTDVETAAPTGTATDVPPTAEPTDVVTAAPTETATEAPTPEPTQAPRQNNGGNPALWIGLIVVGVAAVGTAAYLLIRKKK